MQFVSMAYPSCDDRWDGSYVQAVQVTVCLVRLSEFKYWVMHFP